MMDQFLYYIYFINIKLIYINIYRIKQICCRTYIYENSTQTVLNNDYNNNNNNKRIYLFVKYKTHSYTYNHITTLHNHKYLIVTK